MIELTILNILAILILMAFVGVLLWRLTRMDSVAIVRLTTLSVGALAVFWSFIHLYVVFQ